MNEEDLQSLFDQSQGGETPSTSIICGVCNPTEASSCPDDCQCTGTRASTARRQSSRSATAVSCRSNRSAVVKATEASESKQKKASKPKKKAAATTKATTTATAKSKKKKNTTKSKKKASKKEAVSSCLYLYLTPLFAIYSL